ncbi:MAG: hypothetical protein IJX02_05930 [Clostridia bacterium]|nr:hypothetical protein [Clostridia bacterium]
MGYRISKIKNVPVGFNCYYFLIGNYRNHSIINDLFREDFRIIADELGEDNAIIESTYGGNLENELMQSLHKHYNILEQIGMYETRFPGLLIMWKHPSNLDEKDAIVYIPFQAFEKTYSNSSELLQDLVSYAKKENDNLIKRTKRKFKIIKSVGLSINLGILALNIEL